MTTATIKVPIGELIDKIIILRLKVEKLGRSADGGQLNHYLSELVAEYKSLSIDRNNLTPLCVTLRRVNAILWRLEDKIRQHEKDAAFDSAFVCTARLIARLNDRRAAIKKQINDLAGSAFYDVKYYEIPPSEPRARSRDRATTPTYTLLHASNKGREP